MINKKDKLREEIKKLRKEIDKKHNPTQVCDELFFNYQKRELKRLEQELIRTR